MKILFNRQLAPQFINYGILIPIKAERSLQVFQNLLEYYPKLEEFEIEQIPVLSKEDLLLAHDKDFVERFLDREKCVEELTKTYELVDKDGVHCRYDPLVAKEELSLMVDKIRRQAGATYFAMDLALTHQSCFFLGGGMHHAMSFGGRGFCPINDLIIGIRKLQKENKIEQAWIIDIDAHKGDGPAEITQNDPSITTLSIHMKKGWPLDGPVAKDLKETPWHLPSDIDITIDTNEEHLYLTKLELGLLKLKKNYPDPQLVIVVDGSDPYEKDELPGTRFLKLSKEQMLERDQMVHRYLNEMEVSQTWVMSGGYGARSAEIYTQFLRTTLT